MNIKDYKKLIGEKNDEIRQLKDEIEELQKINDEISEQLEDVKRQL